MPIIMVPKEYADELQHGLLGTTKKRKGAKYIAKVPIGNGKYRYFYNQLEWRAYQAGRAVGNAGKAAGKAVGKAGKATGKAIGNTAKAAGNAIIDASGRKYYKQAAEYEKKADAATKKSTKLDNTIKRQEKVLADKIISGKMSTRASAREMDKIEANRKKYEKESDKAINNRLKQFAAKDSGDNSLYTRVKRGKKKLSKLFKKLR